MVSAWCLSLHHAGFCESGGARCLGDKVVGPLTTNLLHYLGHGCSLNDACLLCTLASNMHRRSDEAPKMVVSPFEATHVHGIAAWACAKESSWCMLHKNYMWGCFELEAQKMPAPKVTASKA